MRVVLADVKAADGFVSKDTVAGGYGSRLRPFSRVVRLVGEVKRRLVAPPSVQMAYLAALAAQKGHDVRWTTGDAIDGDVALVLSSLVDYRNETAFARVLRARGARVGFVGLAASKMPELFADAADFIVAGEPEEAVGRILEGEQPVGVVNSAPINDLDTLPFPRWDLIGLPIGARKRGWSSVRPLNGGFPVLASRSCPEFCTYCPHRILAGHRERAVDAIADELEYLCARYHRPYVIFRDPLFTNDRERCLALCDAILRRRLNLRFECETRLDRLDEALLTRLHRAGLRAMGFGVESVSPETLRKAGRRPIPPAHQQAIIDFCREIGIVTAAFYVFGFVQDTWSSIARTIEFAIQLGSTVAQFKILTPYPGTPLWKQMQPLVFETDWQRFDGFTPTFRHPNLTADELMFLLGAAYSRFYVRPTYAGNHLGIRSARIRRVLERWDTRVTERQAQREIALTSKAVSC